MARGGGGQTPQGQARGHEITAVLARLAWAGPWVAPAATLDLHAASLLKGPVSGVPSSGDLQARALAPGDD